MVQRTLTLGFSPCPNDTFIFDALVHERIDTHGLQFDVVLEDVETLNQWALEGKLDITKLSYHAMCYCTDEYQLLHAGSALGQGCGPLLIARNDMTVEQVNAGIVAIPGKYTTANMLFSMAFPQAKSKKEVLFSEIEEMVLSGQVDAGVIIHESRFTYADKGLIKLIDLGEFWEENTGYPIPLGGIAIKRDLPEELKWHINELISASIDHAYENPRASMPYIRDNAQEMNEEVMQQHIDLYVNDYSIDLGETGKRAVIELFNRANKAGLIDGWKTPLFI